MNHFEKSEDLKIFKNSKIFSKFSRQIPILDAPFIFSRTEGCESTDCFKRDFQNATSNCHIFLQYTKRNGKHIPQYVTHINTDLQIQP